MSNEQQICGRLGNEELPHDCARDSRPRGKFVASNNLGDETCNPTETRAGCAPSPRAVRANFNPKSNRTAAKGVNE
jgi:hypothetical protein